MVEQACRNCHLLTTANICPNCKRSGLSGEWAGELIVIEPEKSVLARRMNVRKKGRYALRVRWTPALIAYQANNDVTLRLKHPLGKLLIGPPEKTISMLREEIERKRPPKLFAIGDTVASNILRSGIRADLVIIDFKSRRQPIEPIPLNNFVIVNVKNPAGVITESAYEAVKEICQRSDAVAIIVDGEEDLLTLPVTKFAPLGAFVVYGQPYVGIVLLTITERVKVEAELLMSKMLKPLWEEFIRRLGVKELSAGCVDVEIRNLAESYNPVFKRKEITFFTDEISSSSPRLYEVKKSLAAKHNASEDTVYVIKLSPKAGTNRTYGEAEIYDSPENAKKIVPRYIQLRNAPKRHEKKGVKAPTPEKKEEKKEAKKE